MKKYVPVIHGGSDDRPDEADTVSTAGVICDVLQTLGYESDVIFVDLDFSVFERLAERQPFAVFNLVESICGDGRLGPMACQMLEHHRLPYTGAGSAAYFQSNSKLLTKTLLGANKLPTADWWFDTVPADRKVIVKSVYEHASYGMDQGSVVEGIAAAREISTREARFGGRFFAEEYIGGREFNVSIFETDSGPVVLPIAEMCFNGFPKNSYPIIDYKAKWDETSDAYQQTKRAFGVQESDPELAESLRLLCLGCWTAADLSGYARVDFRLNSASRINILEINANPCLAPDAGFAAALDIAGISYSDGIAAIVNTARRSQRN
ncbi:D-alanine--D-alanine ligase [Sneathiella sp.]|uniref:D-alanine--D-alanine ligase family protein n=1 Tax=Sneathiella sp. TaxID=1964365 RepID=UPI003563F577